MLSVSDLIGIPYKEHGRTKEEGFDCYGLALEIYHRNGIPLNDVYYENHNKELCDKYAPTLNVKEIEKPEELALIEVTFNTSEDLHIGVCLNDKVFIHATRNQGVRLSPIKAFKKARFFKWV